MSEYILRNSNCITISSGVIAASGSYTSDVITLMGIEHGFFSLEWVLTGDGTGKFEALSSNSGANFLDVNTDIASAQTKITGPGTDGKNMARFRIILCGALKIKITETGGANSITVTAYLRGR